MKKKRFLLLAVICAFLVVPGLALADSISPPSFSATLGVGERVSVVKTVTVSEIPPTTAPVDVFFLADTTGSMWDEIGAVQTGASSIFSATAGLGDVAYGVGEYRDFTDSYAYQLNTSITTDTTAVQAGINTWSASGGGDFEEADLYGLEQVATSGDTGWRTGSTRILIWFGDAPGHDPTGPSDGTTEATATAALQAANIGVEAVDVGFDPPSPFNLDRDGQATRIAAATGGHYHSGIDSSTLADTISGAITSAILTYSSVDLDLSGVPAGVTATATPAHIGMWSRDEDRDFDFTVTFTGDSAGTYDFTIGALVDGGTVALEEDFITVGGEPSVPEPATLLLLGTGLIGLAGFRRKLFKKS